jgi:hypothetical protein
LFLRRGELLAFHFLSLFLILMLQCYLKTTNSLLYS